MTIPSNRFPNRVLSFGMRVFASFPGGRHEARPRNILVVRLGNLGDMIVAVPAYRALRHCFPEAKLTLLTSPTRRGMPGAREALQNDSTFDDIIVYYKDESRQLPFLSHLRRQLREKQIDLAIALPNQLTRFGHLAKYEALLAASGVRRFVGFQMVTPADYQLRQVDRLLRALHPLDIPEEAVAFPWLTPSESDERQAEAWLSPAAGRLLIAMHGGAKRPANRWAVDSFIEAAKRLVAEDNACIVLTGGPDESELTARLAGAIGEHAVDLGGKTSIGPLAAVLRRCAAVVSNDTGVMHVGYAMGTPTVAIFSGRFYPHIWYPYGHRQIVLRKPIDCELCLRDICPKYAYPRCLELISPQEVVEAVRTVLRLP